MVLNVDLGINPLVLVLHGTVVAYSRKGKLGEDDTFTILVLGLLHYTNESNIKLFGWDYLYLAGMPTRGGRYLHYPNFWFIPHN